MAFTRMSSKSLRRTMCLCLSVLLILSFLPLYARADDSKIILVEGESSSTTNFLPGINKDAVYSGGKFLQLFTNIEPPADGYLAQYQVVAPAAGAYQLDVASTPPNASWTSPYEVKINDGSFEKVKNEAEFGQINSTVRKYHLNAVALQEGVNTITFRVNERRVQPDTKYTLFIDYFQLTPIQLKMKAITSDAPLNVFQSGSAEKLVLSLNGPASRGTEVAYAIQDYWSNEVSRNTVTIPESSTAVNVDIAGLPVGHYRVTAQLAGDSQSISGYFSIATPLSQRPALDDSPFAMDTAASWLVPSNKMNDFATVIQLSGVKWVRDRFRWNDNVNPAPGAFNFAADPADSFIPALSAKGIKILDVYHSSPSWSRESNTKLPDDLLAAYQFARSSANHYGDQVQAWEVWNEPDYGSGFATNDETADRYAAVLKAASIGYNDSAAKPLVSVSGFATLPGNYEKILVANDIFPYIDIYNFHRHTMYQADKPITPFPNGPVTHQQFLDQNGGSDKPMWLTEAGIAISSASPNELTWEEQKAQARYMVTSTVTSLSQGTDKHFYFVTAPYQEGSNYWGVLSRAFTPYASYSAQAAMTEALGKGQYVGAWQGLPASVKGHVFRDGSDSVLVLWSSSAETVALPVQEASIEITDIMGRKQTVTSGTYSVVTGPDPVYVRTHGDFAGITVDNVQDTPIDTGVSSARSLNAAQHIVMTQKYPLEVRVDSKNYGYTLADQPTTMTLQIYNLNDTPMSGTIEGHAEGGWSLGDPIRSVSIQPYAKTELQFTVAGTPNVVPNVASAVSFSGTFDGQQTSRTTSYVRVVGEVQISERIPEAGNPAAWRLNLPNAISNVGTGQISAGIESGSVQFQYHFVDGGDRWAYPYLLLPENTDYSAYSGMAFQLYAPQDMANTILRLIVKEKSGARYFTPNGFLIKQGWNQIRVPFEEFTFFDGTDTNFVLDPDQLVSIQLGINTKTNDLPPFNVKDFGVYKNEAPDTTAPVTIAAVLPEQPDGQNGWYRHPVTVSFNAQDNQSGVASTTYSVDGGTPVAGTSVTLSTEGVHTLSYWSEDKAGNVEQIRSVEFKIDKTAPLLSVQLDKTSIWPPNSGMVIIHAALDSSDAASGVESVVLTSITSNEGGQGDIEANIGTPDTVFRLRAARSGSGSGRIYTITYTATDKAGNQRDATATVTVPHDQS